MNLKSKISNWLERQHQLRLERMIERKSTYAILMMLADRRECVRLDAVRALGFCDDDIAFQTLTELLRDPLASVRKAAALALSNMNRPGSAASIERQLHVEKDLPVIDVMRTALFRLKQTV